MMQNVFFGIGKCKKKMFKNTEIIKIVHTYTDIISVIAGDDIILP